MDDATRSVGKPQRMTNPSKTPRPRAIDPLLTDEDEARARELRGEIAETRGEISETIDAIQERLQPGNLVARARETVRNAATEKVKQMANTAGEAADQVLGSSFVETIRANPIPAAMIGIGAAWMLFNRRSESRADRYAGGGPYSSYDETSGRYDLSGEPFDRSYGSTYGVVGTRGTIGGEDADSMMSRAKDYAADVTARAQELTGDVRETARRTSRRAQVKFEDVLRNNPLALGAAAVLVGAVVGMTVPATETENQLMGDARDSVVERARGLASDAADRVSETAGNVQDLASRAADQVKGTTSRTANTGAPRTDRTTFPEG